MKIRAKMVCSDVAQVGNYQTVALSAALDGEENKSFAEATPSARFELCITNPKTIGAFEKDGVYFVDISPAETAKPETKK